MPPPTRLSSMPGSIAFARAAPRNPHSHFTGRLHEPVDVRGVGADAEEARRGALEQKKRRGTEGRRDGVALVAPCGQRALVAPARDATRPSAPVRASDEVTPATKRSAIRPHVEHVDESRERAARASVEPADDGVRRRTSGTCMSPAARASDAQGAHELPLECGLRSSADCSPRRPAPFPRQSLPHEIPR